MLRLSLIGVIASRIGWAVSCPVPAFVLTAAVAGPRAGAGAGAGAGVGAGVAGGAGASRRAAGGSIGAAPANAVWRRDRRKNSPASSAANPAKAASQGDQLANKPRFSAAPCAAGPASLSARLGSDVGDGKLSSTVSAGVRSREEFGCSVSDSLSSPCTPWPGVARAAGVNRRVATPCVCCGAGIWMVGRGRWTGVGVGVGRSVGIRRGATGTGPSISTGPWTWGVAVAVGLGAGRNWNPAGGVAVAAGVAAAGTPAPASASRLHCAITIASKGKLRLGHIFRGWVRQNRANSKAALNRD